LRSPDELGVGMWVLAHLDQRDPHGNDDEHPGHAQDEGQPTRLLALRHAALRRLPRVSVSLHRT